MDKQKILEISKLENKSGDERDRQIELKCYENGFYCTIVLYGVLSMIAWTQKFFTGSSFAEMKVFTMGFLLAYAGYQFTKYFYYKKNYDLFIALILGSGFIINLMMLVLLKN